MGSIYDCMSATWDPQVPPGRPRARGKAPPETQDKSPPRGPESGQPFPPPGPRERRCLELRLPHAATPPPTDPGRLRAPAPQRPPVQVAPQATAPGRRARQSDTTALRDEPRRRSTGQPTLCRQSKRCSRCKPVNLHDVISRVFRPSALAL